ncbi:hypothetical protein CCUS01_02851 [Colletotrichum cuscutae]|uniref:Uncharacterized protein n=1 Tax=Colletotrichum cuscutae TaxID=1209917 RepID=A0AAJ0DPK3_9PEZI|nr:hypothetical protein CCUS01_02851 [Colletotrichum cuscutae]
MASAARRRCRCSVLGYLGFSGLLVCPRHSSQSLGLGGLSIPCPPLSAVGKQLRQGVWPDPLVAGFVKAHRSPEQRDALYGLEWWVHEFQSLLYVEPFLLVGCFIHACTCLR